MNLLVKLCSRLAVSPRPLQVMPSRASAYKHVEKPAPGTGKAFRRIVHYPEEYTVKPLNVTNLGGRDPVSGRMVAKGIGGGIKHKYHWVDWKRLAPKDGSPLVEKVFEVIEDGCRTGHVALVGQGDELRYIMATENMKPGNLITTYSEIPRIPVRPKEGDAHPIGALPQNTKVCCVEMHPGRGAFFCKSAGSCATIGRKVGNEVLVTLPSKREFFLNQECIAIVGRISNAIHSSIPIGSAQRLRWLGYRPRSGLWQRKSGIHGRKIRAPIPIMAITKPREKPAEAITFTLKTF
ncbi:large ribosomal subunit protein uL2m [Neocloeon triangulifer]|uniref:large ribosomal subunit protein uL2m n=1 Tax=Neocloeon triangulifer TaxID=2078957 RepID=UPI00286F1792|nr:large ribosomal subunit protein uL2m [Neocloeon triangulifer]XP_059473008.1 large ribosomal subunit protein uL2m [Neocloeon triangulifer]XP_059473009.1 large ribosomal subunit protein uL2m [Neocloeon triangulifer]XP_059473010.1 large ribosomal subunit protein uL2m [Neocloeon triangulifer]